MLYLVVFIGFFGAASIIGVAGFWIYFIEQTSIMALDERQWDNLASFLSDVLSPLLAFLSLLALTLTLTIQAKQTKLAQSATAISSLLHLVEKLEHEILSSLQGHIMDGDGLPGPESAYELTMSEAFEGWDYILVSYSEGIQHANSERYRWGYSHSLFLVLHDVGLSLNLLRSSVEQYEKITGDKNLRSYYGLKFLVAYDRLFKKGYVDGILNHPIVDKDRHRHPNFFKRLWLSIFK